MTIALPAVIYVHRTHETHERLTRRGVADFDLMEIDRAIDSAVHRTHDESERGGWPDVDDDHTWSRYIEPLVLDYLVAHEMAHLREMNHSTRFWTLVGSLCPHVDEAERWLKTHGAGLHRYG